MRAVGGQELATARQRLEGWRKRHGGRGRRIPESLWSDAVRAARVEGVRETARVLRLRVARLEVRVGEPRSPGARDRRVPGAAFVELTGMGPLGGGRTVVELTKGGGEQMRIHLAGASSADLVSLAEVFWGRRS